MELGDKFACRRLMAFVVVGAVLAGCGGGGDDDTSPPATSAQGAYAGSITGSPSNAAFSAVVLEDGQIWTLYGNLAGGFLLVNGFIQGQGVSNSGVLTATTLRDFGTSPPLAASLSVNYVAGVSISGTLTELGVNLGISGTAIPTANYNYNAPASLASIAGAWTLTLLDGSSLPLTISATGTANGVTSDGCAVSTTFTPRASGKNVFNLALAFGGFPCGLPGGTGNGIAIYSTLDSGAHQLVAAAVDPTRSFGTIGFGSR